MILYFSEKSPFQYILTFFVYTFSTPFLFVSCFRFYLSAGKSNPDHVELNILHLQFAIRSGFKIHLLEVCVTLTFVFYPQPLYVEKKDGFFLKCSSYILLASFMHGVLFGALVPGKGEEIIVVAFFRSN